MLDVQFSTIVFQILNFLILLIVLAKFLYQPLRRTMRERQEAIADQLHRAEARAQQADAERTQLATQLQELGTRADRVLAEARAKADTTAEQIVAVAHREADRLLAEARSACELQERETLAGLERQIRGTAVDLAGQVIARAAGPTVHHALLDDLVTAQLAPGGAAVVALKAATTQGSIPVEIEVAYPPSPEETTALRAALARALDLPAASAGIAFRTEPALIAGARIFAGYAVIDGSLRRALDELRQVPVVAGTGGTGR